MAQLYAESDNEKNRRDPEPVAMRLADLPQRLAIARLYSHITLNHDKYAIPPTASTPTGTESLTGTSLSVRQDVEETPEERPRHSQHAHSDRPNPFPWEE